MLSYKYYGKRTRGNGFECTNDVPPTRFSFLPQELGKHKKYKEETSIPFFICLALRLSTTIYASYSLRAIASSGLFTGFFFRSNVMFRLKLKEFTIDLTVTCNICCLIILNPLYLNIYLCRSKKHLCFTRRTIPLLQSPHEFLPRRFIRREDTEKRVTLHFDFVSVFLKFTPKIYPTVRTFFQKIVDTN